jgi:hypothetical protein
MANPNGPDEARQKSDPGSAGSPSPQGSGTGGGGMTRDEERYSTARKPTQAFDAPECGAGDRPPGGSAAGSGGIGSGLEPGGTKPSNERLAGQGAVGTPGGNAPPSQR